MYACICAQVTESEWKRALEKSDNDWHRASTLTGAGLGCGGCRVFLAEAARQAARPLEGLAVLAPLAQAG